MLVLDPLAQKLDIQLFSGVKRLRRPKILLDQKRFDNAEVAILGKRLKLAHLFIHPVCITLLKDKTTLLTPLNHIVIIELAL